jgi:predicted dehydrogenase
MRIAVIGLGQRIAAVLRALKQAGANLEILGYADPSPVGLPILERENIAPGKPFSSAQRLLAQSPFDLLFIGSPNHLHAEHLSLALDGNSPIFMEKPIVRTEAESLALAKRLKSPHPPVYVGLVLRSAPIAREVLRLVREGVIGEIVSIDATEHLPAEHGSYLARNWRRKVEWGGSFMLDKVCHDFDIFQAIAGSRAARVASFGGRGHFRSDRRPTKVAYPDGSAAYGVWPGGWGADDDAFGADGDVLDHQVAIVEYQNGVRLSFHSSSHTTLQERRWFIAGTHGTLIADIVRNKVMWRRALDLKKPERREWPLNQTDHNGADVAMADDLLATLSGQMEFPVTPYDALDAGLTVMAIDRAMLEKRIIDCSDMWRQLDAS